MTTYPVTTDPLNALTRGDGTTDAHSEDHGHIIDLHPNAKRYLRGDGTTESGAAVTDFAAAAYAAGGAFIPAGTYAIPDGQELFGAVVSDLVIQGAGRETTSITVKNAYGFKAPATGSVDRIAIRDLSVSLRSGSTSGGGIKAVSDSYHSSWAIEHVDCGGVAGSTDALVHLDGFISSHADEMRLSGCGGDALKVTSAGFVSNAFSLARITVQAAALAANTYAGIRISGCGHARVRNCTIESTHGYGVYMVGTTWATLTELWLEDNWNDNIRVEDSLGVQIYNDKFHYHNASAAAAASHIKLINASASQRAMHEVTFNIFQDPSASGYAIDVGTNVEQTLFAHNRGASISRGRILNNGLGTRIIGNDEDPFETTGTGSPEGVVAAPIGSTYRRTDGGTDSSFYVKESGGSTAGWVAK